MLCGHICITIPSHEGRQGEISRENADVINISQHTSSGDICIYYGGKL